MDPSQGSPSGTATGSGEYPIAGSRAPRSLKGKFIIGLVIVSLLGLVATSTALYAMWRMEDKTRIIESFYELNQKILEVRRYEKNYLLFNKHSDLLAALDYVDEVRAALATIRPMLPGATAELRSYQEMLEAYAAIFRSLRKPELAAGQGRLLENQLRAYGQDLTSGIFDLDNRSRMQVEREIRNYERLALFILALALLGGGLFTAYLIKWVTRPLNAISQASARIIRGETTFIPVDEIISASVESQELVNSLNLMLKALNDKQAQLVQSTKLAAIGKVTAGIAHEINNPLNNIALTAEVLLEDLPNLGCAERLEMVNDILVQADRAREVVHHLLAFSRTRRAMGNERLSLGRLIEDSVSLLKNEFRLNRITCHADTGAQEVWVEGNPSQLQQVLVNMMLNAVQAMQAEGQLSVSLAAENGKAVISIRDTGSGISAEDLEHIFDPFFTTKNEGTGLGLSLSYSIVKEHHGDIRVTSRAGEGTTFTIRLPLAPGGDA
ncbi:MAG: ATP-binding protein [Thermodesulfobacteriota bacterium]